MTGTIFSTKAKGVRYLERPRYITKVAVDENGGKGHRYQSSLVRLGKMMEDIRHGVDPKIAARRNIGTHGFACGLRAPKYIGPARRVREEENKEQWLNLKSQERRMPENRGLKANGLESLDLPPRDALLCWHDVDAIVKAGCAAHSAGERRLGGTRWARPSP